ncbi:MAG TPA: PIN domain-containing protein [Lysobacter sp.]|nr:PIN domain-containing protein [Lysobacter sp.]
MRAFVDTNLWAYRLDRRDPGKSAFIRDWLRSLAEADDIVISTQVMIELRCVLTRKLEPALSPAESRRVLEVLAGFDVVSTHPDMLLDAHELAEREQLSWSDALIAEAAVRSRCQVLYSEDFGHDRKIAGLRVCNPFLQARGDAT